jgi:hypothetical protein
MAGFRPAPRWEARLLISTTDLAEHSSLDLKIYSFGTGSERDGRVQSSISQDLDCRFAVHMAKLSNDEVLVVAEVPHWARWLMPLLLINNDHLIQCPHSSFRD